MKSLVALLEALMTDVMRVSGADLSRDVQTVRKRVKHEGDSFITITLPNFCADFERSLDEGRTSPTSFRSFARAKRRGIPAFLQGLLSRVFDKDGILLADVSVDCIRLIRQICLYGKKVERPCTSARVTAATAQFVQCDSEVVVDWPADNLHRWFDAVARILLHDVDLSEEKLLTMRPKHGPRATEERILGNQKWHFSRWHQRLEEAGFAFDRFGRGSLLSERRAPDFVEPLDEAPVRVCFVPKTLRSPRVIAVEPVCMQYAQQGLRQLLCEGIEESPLMSGHLEFRRQNINRSLVSNTINRSHLATIDMAEASDRVSLVHMERLFRSKPEFLAWAKAARSQRAKLPDGTIVQLRKFASMGSALCFPVEALVFYTSIIASRLLAQRRFPSRQSVYESGRSVYVYGDDLIVPMDEAPGICADLETFGFKVNRRKSFWTGKFRESCGVDSYDGEPVQPVYLRRDCPTDANDSAAIVSIVATANQLSSAGYHSASTALREVVERLIGKLPTVSGDSAVIGWHMPCEHVPRRRWDRRLQRFQYLCWIPVPRRYADPLDGDAALAKCFWLMGVSGREGEFHSSPERDKRVFRSILQPRVSDPKHLDESSRPYALSLKRRWTTL